MRRTDLKQDETEPISVYALTEWCLNKDNVGYLADNDDNIFYHYNKKTWLTNM